MCKIYNHLFTGGLLVYCFQFCLITFQLFVERKTQFEADYEKWDLCELPYLALEYKSSAAVEVVSGNKGCKNDMVERI